MSDDDNKTPDEERTVFVPADADKTVPPTATSAGPRDPNVTTAGTNFKPRTGVEGIKVGDVLNHMFEVRRFLARGGMGEVFEGCNVQSDERVAIKVMLPQLAADEKVITMFRKEARTLTRLQHEALVNYRVLAQEPQLGVLYIVTEFIDGVNLNDALGKIEPSPEELAGLLRRLASGLRAAHALGAVHRDISPDNVLLADGQLARAKSIEFGIAKDTDPNATTIVGAGFAGKLNYVAPEQLGDFGRDIGPWTDVYSLALVILAVALGKNVNMSGSLVDAIDKRRKGVDTAKIPESLRPVIDAMLVPDPAGRLRSMDEVLAMLDNSGVRPATGFDPARSNPPKGAAAIAAAGTGGGVPKAALVGSGIVAALLLAGGAWWALGSGVDESKGPAAAASGDPVERARAAVDGAIPSVSGSWLEIGSVPSAGGSARVAMRGVAGDPAAAQRDLSAALAQAGLQGGAIDLGDVAPITQAGCSALDTFRQVRATDSDRLTVPQPRFTLGPSGAVTTSAGIDVAGAEDFAIIGIEPSGAITPLLPSKAAFEREVSASVNGKPIAREGEGRYKLNVDVDHNGWSGYMLVTGKGPIDAAAVAPPIGSRGPSWQQQFMNAAADKGWKTEMVWFETVKG